MHGGMLTIDSNIVNSGDETIGETNIKGTKINLGDHSKVFVNKDGNEVSLQDYVGSTSVDTTKVTDIATAIEKEGQVISIGTQVKKTIENEDKMISITGHQIQWTKDLSGVRGRSDDHI